MNSSLSMRVVLLACLILAPVLASAQPVVNNQDEVVYVDASTYAQRGTPMRGSGDANGNEGSSAEGNDGILTIYRSSVKQDIQNYVTEMVELKHAVAAEVQPYVEQAVRVEGGSSRPLVYKDPATGTKRYYLQVVTTRAQMPYVLKLINTIDLPEMEASRGFPGFDIRMRYRLASEVADVLTNLGVGDFVGSDDKTNTLHIEDRAAEAEGNLRIVDFYDVPPLQIQFDVQIIEIVESEYAQLGLDWEAWKQGIGASLQQVGRSALDGFAVNRLDWLVTLDGPVLAEFLNYAAQNGTVKVNQRVKINANNLAPALISNVQTLPMIDYDGSGGASVVKDTTEDPVVIVDGTNTVRQVRMNDDEVGIRMAIQPVIGTDLVTADVVILSRQVTGFDQLDRPIVGEQEFETVITLKDQTPLHIGTIEKTEATKVRRGIPGLKDIPLVKYLFSVETTTKRKAEQFIIVTPCYCESVAYEARVEGGPGDVLKINDVRLPSYLSREMLPLTDEPILNTEQ